MDRAARVETRLAAGNVLPYIEKGRERET